MRKRLDVSKKLENKKRIEEKVVKCSLPGVVHNDKFLDVIDNCVSSVSKATNRGSLVFHTLILHCLNNKHKLPDLSKLTLFRQCILGKDLVIGGKFDPLVSKIWDKYFLDFPKIEHCGSPQIYTYAAKKYQTNFFTSLEQNFEERQKKYVKIWCKHNDVDKSFVYPIIRKINGADAEEIYEDKVEKFIRKNRKILGNEKIDGTRWKKKNRETLLRYYYHILCYFEEKEEKKFSLVPICKIKSHFVTLDKTVIFDLLNKRNKLKRKEYDENYASYWDDIFDTQLFAKLKRKGKFTYYLETDGTSLNIHYQVEKKKVKKSKKKSLPKRLISIDPGRTNIMYGTEKLPNGKVQTYKLTRGHYYNASGINKSKKETETWMKEITKAQLTYNEVSCKTCNLNENKKFLLNYQKVYKKLWKCKLKKKWTRERFRLYSRKNSCLDKFFQSMKGEVKPTIAFGAAKFNPTAKNEKAVPTSYVGKRCSQKFHTVMVDEFRTTKCCNNCEDILCKVRRKETKLEVRGLRWCSTCRKFLNRDLNASLNILSCYSSSVGYEERPKYLSRRAYGNCTVSSPTTTFLSKFTLDLERKYGKFI